MPAVLRRGCHWRHHSVPQCRYRARFEASQAWPGGHLALCYDDPAYAIVEEPLSTIDSTTIEAMPDEELRVVVNGFVSREEDENRKDENIKRLEDYLTERRRKQEQAVIERERTNAEEKRAAERKAHAVTYIDLMHPEQLHEILPKDRRTILRLLHTEAETGANTTYAGPVCLVLQRRRYELNLVTLPDGRVWCPCDACATRRNRARASSATYYPISLRETLKQPVSNFGWYRDLSATYIDASG